MEVTEVPDVSVLVPSTGQPLFFLDSWFHPHSFLPSVSLSLCVYCNVHLSFISLTVSAKFWGKFRLKGIRSIQEEEEERRTGEEEKNGTEECLTDSFLLFVYSFHLLFCSSLSLSPSYMCLQSLNMRQENRRRMCSVSDEREPLENCSFPFEANTISFTDSHVCEDGDEGTTRTRIFLNRSRFLMEREE